MGRVDADGCRKETDDQHDPDGTSPKVWERRALTGEQRDCGHRGHGHDETQVGDMSEREEVEPRRLTSPNE